VTQSAQRTLDEKKKRKKIGFHICRRSKNGIEKNPEKSRSCVTSYAYDSARWQCTSAFGIGSGIVLRVIRHITHSSSPRQGVGGWWWCAWWGPYTIRPRRRQWRMFDFDTDVNVNFDLMIWADECPVKGPKSFSLFIEKFLHEISSTQTTKNWKNSISQGKEGRKKIKGGNSRYKVNRFITFVQFDFFPLLFSFCGICFVGRKKNKNSNKSFESSSMVVGVPHCVYKKFTESSRLKNCFF
jgi:hypothetical protein